MPAANGLLAKVIAQGEGGTIVGNVQPDRINAWQILPIPLLFRCNKVIPASTHLRRQRLRMRTLHGWPH